MQHKRLSVFSLVIGFFGCFGVGSLSKLEKKGVIVREDSDKRMPPSLRYWKTTIEEDYSGQSQADSEYREYAGQSQLGSEDRKKKKSNNQKNTKKKKLVMRLD